MESTLYKWMVDGNVVYGKRLAVDGGKLVIKRTDTGALDIMNVSDVVEVLPYTVAIKYNQIGKTYHFHAVEGELAVGDLVLVEDAFTIVIVTAVNTNSRIATKALTGYVLTGAKPLTAPVQG